MGVGLPLLPPPLLLLPLPPLDRPHLPWTDLTCTCRVRNTRKICGDLNGRAMPQAPLPWDTAVAHSLCKISACILTSFS